MNPSEYLAFELEAEKVRLNSKITKLNLMLKKEKNSEKVFLIEETIRKIQTQIAEIDKELARRNQ